MTTGTIKKIQLNCFNEYENHIKTIEDKDLDEELVTILHLLIKNNQFITSGKETSHSKLNKTILRSTKNKYVSTLNKITEQSFSKLIHELMDVIFESTEDVEYFFDTIIQVCSKQLLYTPVYGKILKYYLIIQNTRSGLLMKKINEYISKSWYILSDSENEFLQSQNDYDQICFKNKFKKKNINIHMLLFDIISNKLVPEFTFDTYISMMEENIKLALVHKDSIQIDIVLDCFFNFLKKIQTTIKLNDINPMFNICQELQHAIFPEKRLCFMRDDIVSKMIQTIT